MAYNFKRTNRVLARVAWERKRQEMMYPDNDGLLDGTGPGESWLLPYSGHSAVQVEQTFRRDYDHFCEDRGAPTWAMLVREEIAEAFQESNADRLSEELLQVAALCVAWVERIDMRRQKPTMFLDWLLGPRCSLCTSRVYPKDMSLHLVECIS